MLGQFIPAFGRVVAMMQERAAVQSHDGLDQRKAEPAGLLRAGPRRLYLLERLEHAAHPLGRHAGTRIRDRYGEPALTVGPADQLDGAAGWGEFERLVDEVQKHLPSLALIGTQLRQLGRQIEPQREASGSGPIARLLGDRPQKVARIEQIIVEVKLAGLGLGQIDDVIDDPQQPRPVVMDVRHIGAVFLVR